MSAEVEFSLLCQLVDTDSLDGSVLLVRNEDARHTDTQSRLQHRQLLQHAAKHRHVTQAVSHTCAQRETNHTRSEQVNNSDAHPQERSGEIIRAASACD